MATTVGGLPYPVGTDKVVQGDDAIKALADALELRGHGLLVQSFHGGVSPLSATGDYNWTYPRAFKTGTVPSVLISQQALFGDPPASHFICSVVQEYTGNTVASLRFRRATDGSNPGAGGGVYVNVIAIGVA